MTGRRFDTVARDRDVLQFIRDCVRTRSYPPSISEIASFLEADSKVAKRVLERLERDGEITRAPGVARGITVTHSTTHTRTEDL